MATGRSLWRSVIVTMSSIANDNLQDLKTGQLVGATPWRQQVALILGVATRAVALALIPVLLGATWVHSGNGWVFSSEGGGWEFPLFWAVIQGVIALLGSGAYALKPSAPVAVAA